MLDLNALFVPGIASFMKYQKEQSIPLCSNTSDFNLFCNLKGIVHLDAEISHRAFDLGMSKQKLNGPEISGPSVDQGSFCASQRMGPKQPRVQPGAPDPIRNKSSILASRHIGLGTTTTREQELAGLLVGGR